MIKKCKLCGKEYEINEVKDRARKYCSKECSDKARAIKVKEYRLKRSSVFTQYKVLDTKCPDEIKVTVTFPSWVKKRGSYDRETT